MNPGKQRYSFHTELFQGLGSYLPGVGGKDQISLWARLILYCIVNKMDENKYNKRQYVRLYMLIKVNP